jgi:hypothetical protein
MARYVHRFIRSGGADHSLMHTLEVRPGELQIAALDKATILANMGWGDYAADISRAEFDAHPNFYEIDTMIVLYDAEDPDNIAGDGSFTPVRNCWAGFLDEPAIAADIVRLGASGFGKEADRLAKHWLWADYDVEQYQPTGEDSDFPYDSDPQIQVNVQGRVIRFRVGRKTEFKHASGKAKLQADTEADDEKIDLATVDGLKPGMTIHISGNAGGSIIDAAEDLQSQGFIIGGHPDYGGAGCCDSSREGCHTTTSNHCKNTTGTGGDALDYNWPGSDEREKLIEARAYLAANYSGIVENFGPDNDPDGGHQTHGHVAFSGASASVAPINRTVDPDWREGNTTVRLTNPVGAVYKAGSLVTWEPEHEGGWASSAAGYYPFVNLGGVRFDIDLPRGKDHRYELKVFKATGPDGTKHVVETFQLKKHKDDVLVELGNNKDLLGFTLKRDGKRQDKNADAFACKVRPITYGPYTTAKTYDTWKIVRDVGVELGWDTSGVQEIGLNNGLPYKLMPGKASKALDDQSAVDDAVWLALGGENGPELKYRKWGDEGNRVWVIVDPHAAGKLESMPRYEKMHVAYSHDHGFEDIVTLTADPNELSGGIHREYPEVIFSGNEPPPLALAQSFGQPIINYLNTERYYGSKNFVLVEDSANPGVTVPPTRVRPGDKAQHPLDNDVTLRIQQVTLNRDGSVTNDYPNRIPPLERALAVRQLLQNRGARQTRATLGGLRLSRPIKAQNVRGSWKKVETINGEERFDGHANWNDVDEDINGKAIFMREYALKWRYRIDDPDDPDDGKLVRDDDNDVIIHKRSIKLDSLEDDATQLPSRMRFTDIRNPHKYALEFCIDSISMQHKHSHYTDWFSLGKPPMAGAPQPENLVQKVNQHHGSIEFDCDDATEKDSSGDEMLARGVGWFKVKRYMNCADPDNPQPSERYGKVLHGRKTHFRWQAPKHTRQDTFTTEVFGVTARGRLSDVVRVTTGQGAPPAPDKPGPLTFDKGGKKSIRAKGTFEYDPVTPDPDFHPEVFVIEWQEEEKNPTDADRIERKEKRVPVEEAYDPQNFQIRGLKKGEKIRYRIRAKLTQGGHMSAPSPWSDIQTVQVTRKPKKSGLVQVKGKRTGVLAKWTLPTTWNDNDPDGFDKTELAYTIVRLLDSSGNAIVDADGNDIVATVAGDATHHFFPLTAEQVANGRTGGVPNWIFYRAGVDIYGWDDLSDGEVKAGSAARALGFGGTGTSHSHGNGRHRHPHSGQHRHNKSHGHTTVSHRHAKGTGEVIVTVPSSTHPHTIQNLHDHNTSIDMNHSGSTHGHQFQTDGSHQHRVFGANGNTGPASVGTAHVHSLNGHDHGGQTDPSGSHGHSFNTDATHTHNHTSGGSQIVPKTTTFKTSDPPASGAQNAIGQAAAQSELAQQAIDQHTGDTLDTSPGLTDEEDVPLTSTTADDFY